MRAPRRTAFPPTRPPRHPRGAAPLLHFLAMYRAVVLLALLCAGCSSPPAQITVVVSSDTAGFITPCGCTSNQSGGLPRRATFLRTLREKSPVLYLDAGNAIDGNSAYHRAKFAAILAGEARMNVAAHNLGAGEIALGVDHLFALAKESGVPFVSANTADAAGKPLAEPLRIVNHEGRQVAVVGVASPRFASAAVTVSAPRDAILAAIAGQKKNYDFLVVLACLNESELEELASALPEADAIVGGATGQPIAPRKLGPVTLASATNKGKFLAQITLPAAASPGAIVELSGRFVDDPAQLANLALFRQQLGQVDFPSTDTALVPREGFSDHYAGTASCLDCHTDDAAAWKKSGHAHAWATLTKQNAQVDPSCQICHTTGYAQQGGFVSIARSTTPGPSERANVGCESCHGPSAAHVKDPKARTPFLAAGQCLTCHDAENSPTFEYSSYWPRITHGKKLPPPGSAPATSPSTRSTP